MKPFQQLLVAPAALGLLAPMAVNAADLNLTDMKAYSSDSSADQVTSINQFSDVKPTDWAFQALSNLIERYGCVAGYPNGTFKGGQAMTRYEAAALLNACLDRITEVTDELKKLMQEFEKELALIRGRVDGLEARVGELEASQFSTTTKLQGDAVFVIGANSFGGSQKNPYGFTDRYQGIKGPNPAGVPAADRAKYPAANSRLWGGTTFNYDLRLNLITSFTGKDTLYTRLRSGNFANSAFNGNPYNLMALDRAFAPQGGSNVVNIDRLYYSFPIGSSFTALLGARARNTEFLAIKPWYYMSRGVNILDVYSLNGAPGTYNKATGTGFGLMWKQNVKKGRSYFAASTSYIAPNGDNANPTDISVTAGTANGGGLLNSVSRGSWLTQIGWATRQFALTGAWRYGQCGQNFRRGTQFANQNQPCDGYASIGDPLALGSAHSNNFAVTAAWQPLRAGWLPSISLGWGYNKLSQSDSANTVRNADFSGGYPKNANNFANNISASQSWGVGLEWADVLWKGNALGMAVGQPVFATSLRNGATPDDGNYVWEWWYKFQVTDNISVTPALFYLSRPGGQYTAPGESSNVLGGLVQTQFKF